MLCRRPRGEPSLHLAPSDCLELGRHQTGAGSPASAVSTAWAVLQGSDTDAREVLDQLEALDEGLDHDVVAGASFAAATTGAVQDAAWASGRAFDAAFAAAVDLDSTTIRTLEGDAASPGSNTITRRRSEISKRSNTSATPPTIAKMHGQ